MKVFGDIAGELERQRIELPSWAFGNSGTRFKVFPQPLRSVEGVRSLLELPGTTGTTRLDDVATAG